VRRILVVDDDYDIARWLDLALTDAGYQVSIVGCGAGARGAVKEFNPDLILLDLMLPDTDGLLLLTSLKTARDVPVIVLSARDMQVDRVIALKLGADDFVAKPFDFDELLARASAVLRRARPASSLVDDAADDVINVGSLTIAHSRRLVTVGGQPIQLTPTEYRLLHVLAMHANEVVPHATLVEKVWGYPAVTAGHLVDTHLWRLRQKLRRGRAEAPRIASVRRRGYTLTTTGLVAN
jgi:DNA-binding response OmpR family regulator